MADNTKYVSLGSVTRKGNKFTVKHTVQSANAKKIDRIRLQWVFDGSRRDATVDMGAVGKNNGNTSYTIKRTSWYPLGSFGTLKKVRVRAIGRVYNSRKKAYVNKGKWSAWSTLTFKAPNAPSITAEVDPDKGEVKFEIKTSHPSNKNRECYMTTYSVQKTGSDGSAALKKATNSTNADFSTSTFDMSAYTSLQTGEYIRVKCTANAKGFGGKSGDKTAEHVFARPYPPVIESAKLSGNFQTGIVTVSFTVDTKGGNAPIDEVQLWRLKSEVTTKEEAANASGWDAVEGAIDDGQVKGLVDNAADARPVEPGTHVWYRVSAKRDNLTTLGEPFECGDLYLAKSTTSTGTVTLSALGAGDSWAKIDIVNSETDDDAVRISWSDYEDAWESTKQPDSFDVTWLDEGKAVVYVRELENGKRYWFRGQSVDHDSEGEEVLGGLSEAVQAIPSSDFGTVSVTVPANVSTGDALDVSWAFSSDMEQESAEVLVGDTVAATVIGAQAEAKVPAEVLEPYSGAKANIKVRVHAGGSAFISEGNDVIVADLPSCTVSAATLAKQPMSFTVATDSPNDPTVSAYIIAQGATGSGLDGDPPQIEGDCVWSGNPDVSWAGDGPYTASITIPDSLRFIDGGEYTVYATVHDATTNLDSAEASADFDVAWSHQAGTPTGSVEVDRDAMSATVTVNAPTGADGGDAYAAGDRFDLYRVTMDGEHKIAESLAFGTSVTDRFAPFGREANLRYMAVTRTTDGDWAVSDDLEYELPGGALRFDWGNGESLELPFNIEDSSGYEKGYEEGTTLDGNIIGWWDGSSRRTASLKTALVKLRSADEEEGIASIARYAGPVFVRTPAGAAFPGNVVPSDISRSYDTRAISVSLECNEVALTAEHMPAKGDIVAPAWNGGAVYESGGVVFDTTGNFPMDDWTFLGYAGHTLYVTDPDQAVRDGSGSLHDDYSWDGETLLDGGGNVIELSDEEA